MSEAQCTLCRGNFPEAQIFQLDGRAVCAGCKPALLARVLSGAPEPLEPVDLSGADLEFGEMLGTAWTVFRGEWLRLLPLVVGVSLLCTGVLTLFPEHDQETAMGVFLEIGEVSLVDLMFGILAALGGCWLVRERLEGRRGSLVGALAHAGRRWLAGVGTGWLESVILVFFLLLLIVPGVIFAVYYTFSTTAVALSGLSGMTALRHSKTLVAGRWWRVFGYSMALMLPVIGLSFAEGLLTAVLPGFTCPKWVSNLVLDLAILPAMVALTVLYLHLDARHRVRLAAGEGSVSGPPLSGQAV